MPFDEENTEHMDCIHCRQYEQTVEVMEKGLEKLEAMLLGYQLKLQASEAAANLALMLLDAYRARSER